MLRYELDKRVYVLSQNPDDSKGAVLEMYINMFLQGDAQKVTVRYTANKKSTVEVPNIPRWFNAMMVNAIQAKFDRIVRSSEGGPFEALKAWFEFRLHNQELRK